jgi:hypothetical protein
MIQPGLCPATKAGRRRGRYRDLRGRLILDARPPVTDAILAAVAEHCSGPLPAPLVDLWRTSFGGSLHYDLWAELGGDEVAVSLREWPSCAGLCKTRCSTGGARFGPAPSPGSAGCGVSPWTVPPPVMTSPSCRSWWLAGAIRRWRQR